tara:strand:- start:12867 stop:14192 length:1326 start_codon:yes stop_codon:yes gene_type:complete
MNLYKKIFHKKKILIYGMGKTGLSSYKYLKKYNKIFLYDDDKKIFKKKYLKKLYLEKKKINNTIFDYILISPGINLNNCVLKKYLKKNFKKIITDLDVFFSNYPNNKIITITGTNGKSTTAQLLNLILQDHKMDSRLCGNIGKPILSEKKITKKTLFVIEASSYQIAYSRFFKTNYAIILNISPDHLERHGSINNYVEAKFRLVKQQRNRDFAFMNTNNKHLSKKILNNKIQSKIIDVNSKIEKNIIKKITNPYFLSQGNIQNLSFIFSLGKKINLMNKKIINRVNKFRGLKYRQQVILKNNKISIINDSKATSFASSIDLLKSLGKVYWIVGGIGKLGDKFILKKKECLNIKAYIFGKNKKFFGKKFKGKLKYLYFKDLSYALKKILLDLKGSPKNLHKTVLFSPSAASFDSFKNFEERGEYFNFLLKKYKVKNLINDFK